MSAAMKPSVRPANPCFSSGPCAKRPGWSLDALRGAAVGRSHRAPAVESRLAEVVARSKALLEMPDDWRLGILAGSDTGAFEAALWSLLGARGVDVLVWESFGAGWADDALRRLGVADARVHEAAYGELPDFRRVSPDNDIVFVWNAPHPAPGAPDGDWNRRRPPRPRHLRRHFGSLRDASAVVETRCRHLVVAEVARR